MMNINDTKLKIHQTFDLKGQCSTHADPGGDGRSTRNVVNTATNLS